MTEYSISVESMMCDQTQSQYPDCVLSVSIQARALDTATGVSVVMPTLITLAPPNGTYTAYADLTQDQVLNWVRATDRWQRCCQALDQALAERLSPPVISRLPPWAQVSTSNTAAGAGGEIFGLEAILAYQRSLAQGQPGG